MEWIAPATVVVAAICLIPWWIRYHRRNLDEFLAPDLLNHRLTLVASRPPRLLERGPFPLIRVRVTLVQTSFGIKKGEQDHLRVCTVRDPQGHLHVVWARIVLTAFVFEQVEWRPPLEEISGKV